MIMGEKNHKQMLCFVGKNATLACKVMLGDLFYVDQSLQAN